MTSVTPEDRQRLALAIQQVNANPAQAVEVLVGGSKVVISRPRPATTDAVPFDYESYNEPSQRSALEDWLA